MTQYRLVAAATAFLVMGCAPAPVDRESELLALREATEAYHAAASAKQAANVVALYDENAVMVPPNDDLVEALPAIGNYRFGFIETPGVSLEFEILRAEVSTSGDMGWTLALGEITIEQEDGEPGRDQVRDFHVWKKQADGSWRVVVDVWNSGLPASD